jgi:hypothetical protein
MAISAMIESYRKSWLEDRQTVGNRVRDIETDRWKDYEIDRCKAHETDKWIERKTMCQTKYAVSQTPDRQTYGKMERKTTGRQMERL